MQANIKQDRGPGAEARSSHNFGICFSIGHLWLDQEYSDGYGAAKKASPRLTAQVDAFLGVLNTLAFDGPGDETYASIRTQLELAGTPIGGNDLLIAAPAVALHLTPVTDNDKELSMNAVFTPTRLRVTTDRYQKMVASGVLTKQDRVELIEGEMLERAPIDSKHSAITARLHERFVLALAQSATVIVGGPVNLGECSEPQPDLMLLKRRTDFYGARIPEAGDILLLVEVSDSSLAFDQGSKLALYARNAVPEYWVIDVEGARVVTYLEPVHTGYALKREFAATESVSPQAFPALKFTVGEIFG